MYEGKKNHNYLHNNFTSRRIYINIRTYVCVYYIRIQKYYMYMYTYTYISRTKVTL